MARPWWRRRWLRPRKGAINAKVVMMDMMMKRWWTEMKKNFRYEEDEEDSHDERNNNPVTRVRTEKKWAHGRATPTFIGIMVFLISSSPTTVHGVSPHQPHPFYMRSPAPSHFTPTHLLLPYYCYFSTYTRPPSLIPMHSTSPPTSACDLAHVRSEFFSFLFFYISMPTHTITSPWTGRPSIQYPLASQLSSPFLIIVLKTTYRRPIGV